MKTSQILETIHEVTERTLSELKHLDYSNLPIVDLIRILNGCVNISKSLEKAEDGEDEIDKLWAEMQKETQKGGKMK